MNYAILTSILGRLIFLLSGFFFAFAFVGYIIYPLENQGIFFLAPGFIAAFVGFFLLLAAGKVEKQAITFREAFATSGLGWIIIAFFGALPLFTSGDIPSFTDAYFESMSGFTTTGASILSNIEVLGHTTLLWRSFTHWLGGMGIVVLSVAILPALGRGGTVLFSAEAPGPSTDKIVPRIGETARILYYVYTLLTVVLFLLLLLGGMNIFESATHTFGTMGTGGFSPLNASVGHYARVNNPMALYYEVVIILFMFIAGGNFALHYDGLRGNFRAYWENYEFRFYFSIVTFAILSIALDLYANKIYNSLGETIRHSTFATLSIVSTTGYGTEDFDKWPTFSKFILLFLMFIGGSAGSTAGGIKVIRVMTLTREAFRQIGQIVHPSRVYTIRFGEIRIPKETVESINSFVIIYILLYILGIILLSLTGKDFETIASMIVACISNIGPGFGEVGPSQNYSALPGYAKWILSFYMLLGRLELLPILALGLPRLWIK